MISSGKELFEKEPRSQLSDILQFLNQSKGNSKFNVVYDIELLKKIVFFLYSKKAPEIQRNSKIHEKYKKSQTKNTMVHDCLPFFRNKKTIDFISWAKETGILCPNSPSIGV